ncbi:hypothetical protein NQ314_008106 [Rhamnusium bicolor]|uniref:Uncharacterized protein n=1 Tax=Rhamnusium bicolor TaxID=1586634 RepID=A0AAV8YFX1_9CUCU|nr:hypothetical protein NQ314_008106 [Rhamnusium bicolor]
MPKTSSCIKNVSELELSGDKVFLKACAKIAIAANIPLKKLQNTQFKEFLQEYCNQNIPDESTIRKKTVHAVYKTVIQEIKVSLDNGSVYIIVDESIDTCGRYIAHLIIEALQENNPSKPYLIASKELGKTNNVTVTPFIQSIIPDIMVSLESRNLRLSESINFVESFSAKCKKIPGDVGIKVREKLDGTVEKNEGFKSLQSVNSIIVGKSLNEVTP